jgi:hypothetical protein
MFTQSKPKRSKIAIDARQFDEAQLRIAALTVNLTVSRRQPSSALLSGAA